MISVRTRRGHGPPLGWHLYSALPRKYVDANFASLDAESFYSGATPEPISGDVLTNGSTTDPGAYDVTMLASGLEIIDAGGDSSRQSFPLDFYRFITRAWQGQATAYVNNQAPQYVPPTLDKVLEIDVAMDAVDLDALASDAEGDVLTGSVTSGTLPNGTSITDGVWSGTPDTETSGEFEYTVVDLAGDTSVLEVTWTIFDTIAVPDVVGMDLGTATGTLVAEGLVVADPVLYESSELVAEGVVISQDPVATTEVSALTEVTLTVSTGPEATLNATIAALRNNQRSRRLFRVR